MNTTPILAGATSAPAYSRKQLDKFIRIRNESGFSSNLQFQFDLDSAGIKIADLGDVEKIDDPAAGAYYRWRTPYGWLTEWCGKLAINDFDKL